MYLWFVVEVASVKIYFWVGVTIRAVAPPDVHLVLCGFLVDRVVKVNRVGVLHSVVLPEQQATNSH